MQSGEIQLLSKNSSGTVGNGQSINPTITPDGRYVVFSSSANNLVLGDNDGVSDVFRIDLHPLSGPPVIELVSRGTTPSISADGTRIAFVTDASLAANDVNGKNDVYVKDYDTGSITLISQNDAGSVSNNGATTPVISADGSVVSFVSGSSNLVDDDTNHSDLFAKNLDTNLITRVSSDNYGHEFSESVLSGSGTIQAMTTDGAVIAFQTQGLDADGFADIYATDVLSMQENVDRALDFNEISVDITPAVGDRDIVIDWGNGEISSVQDSVAGTRIGSGPSMEPG